MRRNEFSVEEEQDIQEFLDHMTFGFLGTVTQEGEPRVTPLNFVYENGIIYFHGSYAGEKMKNIKAHAQVSFTVAEEYSLIPSYYTDAELACPATAYFKSVTLLGHAEAVTDLEEKAAVLGAFMRKLQPEGGYAPIQASDERYRVALKGVSVTRIMPSSLTAKFKFGQNLSAGGRKEMTERLEERAQGKDFQTAELMRKYCPFHSS